MDPPGVDHAHVGLLVGLLLGDQLDHSRANFPALAPRGARTHDPAEPDGHIVVTDGVAAPKFLDAVEQRTFSAQYAAAAGQPVLYVTERCVFGLAPVAWELIEIAPGIDLHNDVLAHLGFTPIIEGEPKLMDEEDLARSRWGSRAICFTVPLEARFAYDAGRNIFFLNMEGLTVHTPAQLEAITAEAEKRLAAVGKKGARRGQLRQPLPCPRPRRRVRVRRPRPRRTALRKCHPVHHQLVFAAALPRTSTRPARKRSNGSTGTPTTDPAHPDRPPTTVGHRGNRVNGGIHRNPGRTCGPNAPPRPCASSAVA